MSDDTIEVCGMCGKPKKRLVLLNSTVQYCPCEDSKQVPAQAGNTPNKQLDLFPDPFDWSDINPGISPWNNNKKH